MSSEVRVPALPESVADATVLAWHKAPGEAVKKDENLVDLETDKVVLEVPAPVDGVLGPILAEVGAVVTAASVLATIEPAGLSRRPLPPSPARRRPSLAGAPVVAPAARRLVKEMDLDASQIPGSGRDGRVHKADVVAFLDEREKAGPSRDPESAAPVGTRPGARPARPAAPSSACP